MQNVQLAADLCTQITKSAGQMLMKYFTRRATEMLNFHIIIRDRSIDIDERLNCRRLWTGCWLSVFDSATQRV